MPETPLPRVLPTPRDLWAKLACDDQKRVTGWHSLVHHSADVAAVLLALLQQPTIAARLARLANRDSLDHVTCERLGALAFLHDIGKANRGFRARVDPGAPRVGHIDQLGWLFTRSGARYRDQLDQVLGLDRLDAWFNDEEWALFETIFAHHGRPWRCDPSRNEAPNWSPGPDGDPIGKLAEMRDALDRWFDTAFLPGSNRLPQQSAFHHAFAGLLMLADWLGSGAEFFPFANGAGPDRIAEAKRRAKDALEIVGLDVTAARERVRTARLGFAETFAGREPRPVQAISAQPDALCVVLEAETGSGKTEAALWRFKRLFEEGAVDGLYFALPTRVAATAMFERVKAFRDRVFGGSPPAVVLAVPGQAMVDEAEGRLLPNFGFEWDDAPDGGASRARWAAEHPKRFLAAPIAVGTVDQALLGAIRVKHAHMRGAALLRHLLVVDEVHASDRYMEALLSTLLRNHVAAGGHALLLSATLGAAARARLLGTPHSDPAAAEMVPYPVLSWAEGGQERRQEPERPRTDAKTVKRVEVKTAPLLDKPDAIARLALDAVEAGAKVLIIRNTVGAAVATARALEAVAEPDDPRLFRLGGVATVHHGRFAAPDRRALDGAVEGALGKDRAAGGRVVAGTQTLEVSLDLDADLLLTDLCPADVLLQRIGRLHRHAYRVRLDGFERPHVIVLVPGSRDLLPFVGRRGGRHGLGRVYDDLCVIEATWQQIETLPVWTIPDDNRRLVERTAHPVLLDQIKDELVARDAAAWTRHTQEKEGKVYGASNEAKSVGLDWSVPFKEFRVDPDEHIATRLGAADRQVDLPAAFLSPFGLPMTALRVQHFLLDGVPPEAEPEDHWAEFDAVGFRLGPRWFRYDRFGLQRDRAREGR